MPLNGRSYVTIASDISLSTGGYGAKVATWAIYIRGDFGTVQKSGRFHNYEKHTWRLELQALCNAIHIASKYTDLSKCKLIIYSEVSQLFTFKYKKDADGNPTTEPYKRELARYQFFELYLWPALGLAQDYEVRAVKAHTGIVKAKASGEKKYYMNRWCDKASRDLMKQLRRKGK